MSPIFIYLFMYKYAQIEYMFINRMHTPKIPSFLHSPLVYTPNSEKDYIKFWVRNYPLLPLKKKGRRELILPHR